MIVTQLSLRGACLVQIETIEDERGYFARTFCKQEFARHGLISDFPQHSISFNKVRGTLRGLHYKDSPFQETKLVRCTRGSIFDVLVDMRAGSPTYARWLCFNLSESNSLSLYIPSGLAHGFITLEDKTEVHYQITPEYAQGHDRSIRWDDAHLAIEWPLEPRVMSDNDRDAPALLLKL